MKSLVLFTAGATVATAAIGYSIREDLPRICERKINNGMNRTDILLSRVAFGKKASEARASYLQRYSIYG